MDVENFICGLVEPNGHGDVSYSWAELQMTPRFSYPVWRRVGYQERQILQMAKGTYRLP
jgi:hypothetical protein